jgi:alcohol dehydrogenase, propanol-preferring
MRVALPWLGYACGVCRYCNTGRETLCEQQLNTGYGINGSFAEYAVGYARHVVRVPDGVSSADAAPLTCAGVTTYKAVKVSEATSSSLVAVFGAGGLGHLAVQYARITGASVVAVDTNPARLRTALEVGAEHIVNPLEEDPIAAIKRLGGAGCRDRHRGHAVRVRAGVRLAGPRRHARLRRAARREPPQDPALRDRPGLV